MKPGAALADRAGGMEVLDVHALAITMHAQAIA